MILLDIDGTCMPISYFPHIMQPYLPNNIRQYVAANLETDIMKDILMRLRIEYKRQIPKDLDHRVLVPEFDGKNGAKVVMDVFTNFMAQTDEGKKSETIMALAWLVWLDGFRKGSLASELFNDVPVALERWKQEGISICSISSMISLGQQLVFTCTRFGNLDDLFAGYLCTKDINAHKSNSRCFTAVCEKLDVRPKELLFLTDSGKEAVAAKDAGCRSILVERPGNIKLQESYTRKFNVITSFNQFAFE